MGPKTHLLLILIGSILFGRPAPGGAAGDDRAGTAAAPKSEAAAA